MRKRSPAHRSDKRILRITGIYLMANVPYIWKSKFGISDTVGKRRANVSETTSGYVFTVASAKITSGHAKEGFVHAVYAWANAPFRAGSGRSEWFLNVSPMSWAVGFSALPGLDWWMYALLLLNPLVWLDGLLLLLVFWAFDVVLLAAVIALIGYLWLG